jgi:hypothetical protein
MGALKRQQLYLQTGWRMYQARNLKATCKQLSDLLAGHHFSPAVRNRVEDLLKDIQRSTLVEKAQLRADGKFPKLYLNSFVKPGKATGATILDLRKVVQDELENAKQQFSTFNAIRRKYAQRKRDLAAVI